MTEALRRAGEPRARAAGGAGIRARPHRARRQARLPRRCRASCARSSRPTRRCCRSRPRRWSPRSTRDAMMADEAEHFPAYGFESNRGYPAPRAQVRARRVRAHRRSTGARGSSWTTACGAASRASSASPRLFSMLTAADARVGHARRRTRPRSADHDLRALFAADPDRADRLHVDAAGWHLDYAKHRVTDETMRLLVRARRRARAGGSGSTRRSRGEHVNVTEDRPVLHMALRMPADASLVVDGVDVVAEVHARAATDGARSRGRCATARGAATPAAAIRNVVNIGIGGSDLGPAMAYDALRAYSRPRAAVPVRLQRRRRRSRRRASHGLDAAETLFVVSSKTFTTLETITNATLGARRGCSTRSAATRRRSRGTSSRCRRTRRRSPSSASTPRTCSSSGTGSAAATRCGRRSACR